MDDGPCEIKVIRDHFWFPTSGVESLEDGTPSITKPGTAKFFEGGIASWWKRGKKPMIRKSLGIWFYLKSAMQYSLL